MGRINHMTFTIPENLHPDLMPLAWLVGSWGSGDNYDDLTLESEALVLFKMSEDEIKREVDRRYALAVAQHEVTGWVDRLVKILKS